MSRRTLLYVALVRNDTYRVFSIAGPSIFCRAVCVGALAFLSQCANLPNGTGTADTKTKRFKEDY